MISPPPSCCLAGVQWCCCGVLPPGTLEVPFVAAPSRRMLEFSNHIDPASKQNCPTLPPSIPGVWARSRRPVLGKPYRGAVWSSSTPEPCCRALSRSSWSPAVPPWSPTRIRLQPRLETLEDWSWTAAAVPCKRLPTAQSRESAQVASFYHIAAVLELEIASSRGGRNPPVAGTGESSRSTWVPRRNFSLRTCCLLAGCRPRGEPDLSIMALEGGVSR